MFHIFNLNAHLTAVRRWAKSVGGSVSLDVDTYRASVVVDGRTVVLNPKFSFRAHHGLAYSNTLNDDTVGGFVGWLPYLVKRWPISTDKIIFKRYCEANGLRVTPSWRPPEPHAASHFIVKRRNGSFGQNIFGPYRLDQSESIGPMEPGDYCEGFVLGRTCKIWYWNGEPVALEALELPYLIGDGRRSLNALASERRASFDKAHTLETCTQMLAWQGWHADDVVPEGERVYLDFKFVTPFDVAVWGDRDCLAKQLESLRDKLSQVGSVLWSGIPLDVKHNSVFTVDAILDSDNELWLLEMNSNPMVHPSAYGPMLSAVFGRNPPAA